MANVGLNVLAVDEIRVVEIGVNEERVLRWRSWVVGSDAGGGGGWDEEKPAIDHRTIDSFSALDIMRSW